MHDYIYNNIYSSKYCESNKQKIIENCNKILSKYFSIENIIYHQILFENLIFDNKWMNCHLKNIKNNKIFNQLKQLLNS